MQRCACVLALTLLALACGQGTPVSPSDDERSAEFARHWSSATVGTTADGVGGHQLAVTRRADGAWTLLSREDALYEYTHGGTGWIRTRLGPQDTDIGMEPDGFVAGALRQDGISRLYVPIRNDPDREVFELERSGGAGEERPVASFPNPPWLATGDPDRDGIPSLFAAYQHTWPGPYPLEELRFQRGRWERTTIDPRSEEGACTVQDLAAGDPRGTGADRLYLLRRFLQCPPQKDDAEIAEYGQRPDGAWERQLIARLPVAKGGVGYGWRLLGVWRAREGPPALYLTNAIDEWYEVSFSGGAWQTRRWEHLVWSKWGDAGACAAGEGRNDGRLRVYCVGCCGTMDEITYERGTWVRTGRMKMSPPWALMSVAVGPARNDGVHRVYVRRFGAQNPDELVELTYQP